MLGRVRGFEVAVFASVVTGLCLLCGIGWTASSPIEGFGFVTGGACVWLGVRQSVWTWPIGLANNIAFLALFWWGRLYADAMIQVVFFVLGVYGWWNWLSSAADPRGPVVKRTRSEEWIALLVIAPLATIDLDFFLIVVEGASPFWDGLTAVLSLVAQFLMCRKRLENWAVWIIADVIYIPLYFRRGMPLTAVLYAVFLLMCIAGWFQWRGEMGKDLDEPRS